MDPQATWTAGGCRRKVQPPIAIVSLQLFQEDITVPNVVAVVLQADVALLGERGEGPLELVFGAVRVLFGRGPLREVDIVDEGFVDPDLYRISFYGELQMIPFAARGEGVGGRSLSVIERADAVLAGFLIQGCIENLDLKTALHGVFGICSKEEAAVAVPRELELQFENEVVVNAFRPKHAAFDLPFQHAIFGIDRPKGPGVIRRHCPAFEGMAVEQGFVALRRGDLGSGRQSEGAAAQEQCEFGASR